MRYELGNNSKIFHRKVLFIGDAIDMACFYLNRKQHTCNRHQVIV